MSNYKSSTQPPAPDHDLADDLWRRIRAFQDNNLKAMRRKGGAVHPSAENELWPLRQAYAEARGLVPVKAKYR